MLATLEGAGITLVLVSQKAKRTLAQVLAQFAIEQCFTVVLGSDDVTAAKPHGAMYERHIIPVCGDPARDRVLVVGDTDIDLRFAANIGARSCWAEYGYGHPASCRALNPTYTIRDVAALPSVCGFAA